MLLYLWQLGEATQHKVSKYDVLLLLLFPDFGSSAIAHAAT